MSFKGTVGIFTGVVTVLALGTANPRIAADYPCIRGNHPYPHRTSTDARPRINHPDERHPCQSLGVRYLRTGHPALAAHTSSNVARDRARVGCYFLQTVNQVLCGGLTNLLPTVLYVILQPVFVLRCFMFVACCHS